MTAFWAEARARAAALDAADPLAATRALFHLPEGLIYLDGNSLGPAPKAAPAELEAATGREWAEGLIRSWNTERWFDLPVIYGDRLAPLIGADPGEVVVCDTVSVNIAKALHAALNATSPRASPPSAPASGWRWRGARRRRSRI
jgi:kynureninase